ncbi:MAG TPA: hypothetical protein DHW63_07675 [Hyphomonadaceae bacterium]|nr:hypothetical protein [Hyphomonadaceae bacterium]
MRGLLLSMALLTSAVAHAQTADLLGGNDGPQDKPIAGYYEFAGPRQVTDELDTAGRSLVAWRYVTLDSDVISLMAAGEAGHRETYRLDGGREYLFQAACDRMCDDIDLEVSDEGKVVLARDSSEAAWPAVSFTPPASGRYTVRVWLTRCAADYCYAGFRGYGRVP